MANAEHLKILKQGVEVWNKWKYENSGINPDFCGASLGECNLSGADFRGAFFYYVNLSGTNLYHTNFSGTNLSGANLSDADLNNANFSGANLTRANLTRASINLTNLSDASLTSATLVETNFEKANLSNCSIYGIAAWDLNLTDTIQKNLDISNLNQPTITVDNVEVAQFIYLMIHNEKIRDVIDTIGRKAVLILGRFTPERKNILDAIREELRKHDYLPILFDFEKPASKDLTETVSTLAHMSRFIIADITDAKSIPQELQAVVPHLPSVAVQPLIHVADREYGMFEHFKRYPWVLPIYHYKDQDALIKAIGKEVIEPAEAKVKELRKL